MNTQTMIAAAAVLASLSAFAHAGTVQAVQANAQPLTPVQVEARSLAPSALGEFLAVAPATGPALTRAAVRSELAQARADGQLLNGELAYVPRVQGRSLSRAEVRSALQIALSRGEIPIGEQPLASQT
jgi:hypothetical protein